MFTVDQRPEIHYSDAISRSVKFISQIHISWLSAYSSETYAIKFLAEMDNSLLLTGQKVSSKSVFRLSGKF